MINNEVLNKIYNKFMITNTISIRELIQLGLKSKDIKKLLLLKYIGMDSVGNYVIDDVDSLYQYGLELLENNQKEEAYLVFKKCYELSKNNEDLNYDLYFSALDNKDYESAKKYFNSLNINKTR